MKTFWRRKVKWIKEMYINMIKLKLFLEREQEANQKFATKKCTRILLMFFSTYIF